jgi:hypothetical protein
LAATTVDAPSRQDRSGAACAWNRGSRREGVAVVGIAATPETGFNGILKSILAPGDSGGL